MAQVIKKRVVLASVLKTVADTRMYEKLGLSLARHFSTEVHLIGFPAETPAVEGIYFHNIYHKPFRRISMRRLLAPAKVLIKLFQLRPRLVIITTHELLVIGAIYKLLTRTKLYYDVQENYYYNIRFTAAFPKVMRLPVAVYVRLKEQLFSIFVNYFFLAEKGYVDELIFAKPFIVLENKLPASFATGENRNNRLHLLFTGTLAETTGVWQAIELAEALYRVNNQVRLTVIGHAPSERFLKKLREASLNLPFVHLTAELFPLPHPEILRAIRQAGTGIIIYPPNPATHSSIPTKLYEYMGMGLPVLIRHNPLSHDLVMRCRGGILLTEKPDYQALVTEIQQLQPPVAHPTLYWESELPKLQKIFSS
ncbi:MAG: glycosyltransferase [Cyclobacteriaceae bacterium]|nr:glycosyltransferase [Cyclobacteriaceae bacterium]